MPTADGPSTVMNPHTPGSSAWIDFEAFARGKRPDGSSWTVEKVRAYIKQHREGNHTPISQTQLESLVVSSRPEVRKLFGDYLRERIRSQMEQLISVTISMHGSKLDHVLVWMPPDEQTFVFPMERIKEALELHNSYYGHATNLLVAADLRIGPQPTISVGFCIFCESFLTCIPQAMNLKWDAKNLFMTAVRHPKLYFPHDGATVKELLKFRPVKPADLLLAACICNGCYTSCPSCNIPINTAAPVAADLKSILYEKMCLACMSSSLLGVRPPARSAGLLRKLSMKYENLR